MCSFLCTYEALLCKDTVPWGSLWYLEVNVLIDGAIEHLHGTRARDRPFPPDRIRYVVRKYGQYRALY